MDKRRLFDIILLAVAVVFAYAYREPLSFYARAAVYEARNAISPCSAPLTYRIDKLDPRFGLSREQFADAIGDAATIWEGASGKDLFRYSESGWLKVSLLYDYRQETSSKLQGIGADVETSREAYDALKAQYLSLKSQFAVAKSSYDAAVAAFFTRNSVYQDSVKYWNQRGGAPRNEFDKLKETEVSLEKELSGLRVQESALNAQTAEINQMVSRLNAMAIELNISVEDYNALGRTLGETFEEGFYQAKGFDRKIDIYEFKDRTALVRVLAHELGHALDFEHVEDASAMMYSLDKASTLELSAADMGLVRSLCDIK